MQVREGFKKLKNMTFVILSLPPPLLSKDDEEILFLKMSTFYMFHDILGVKNSPPLGSKFTPKPYFQGKKWLIVFHIMNFFPRWHFVGADPPPKDDKCHTFFLSFLEPFPYCSWKSEEEWWCLNKTKRKIFNQQVQ